MCIYSGRDRRERKEQTVDDESYEEDEILVQVRTQLARTIYIATLLHAEDDHFPDFDRVRRDVDAAIVYLERAVAAIEASIAHGEAERQHIRRVG